MIIAARTPENLTQKALFITWIPLGIMWILMAVEQPLISAVITRTGDATRQLASFGFTFALALLVEGPVVQMLAAGTALSNSRKNYHKLLTFMHIIGWGATLIHLFMTFPPVFNTIALNLFHLPPELVHYSRICLICMLPWTVSVGYRRLWQGVLIRYNKTKVIPVTMFIRLTVSGIILLVGYRTRILTGAALGGLALSGGTISGAIAAGIYARPIIKKLPDSKETEDYSWKYIISFYIPLALMNFINLGARPLMNLGITRGYLPIESLALWPVIFAYFFLYTSLSLSLQEIVIAKMKDTESYKSLFRFVTKIAFFLFSLFLLVQITPLWKVWFFQASGLTPEIGRFIPVSLFLLIPLPLVTAYISLLRGYFVSLHKTKIVTTGVLINVAALLTCLFTAVSVSDFPAIYIVTFAFSLASVLETFFLILSKIKLTR